MNPTAGQIIDEAAAKGAKPPEFFLEILDIDAGKCLGVIDLSSVEIEKQDRRKQVIGYTGRTRWTLQSNLEVRKGQKLITIKASTRKPIHVTETLFPCTLEREFKHPLDP